MLTEIESLANALREAPPDDTKTKQATDRLLSAAQRATLEERSEAVRRLSSLISLDDPKRGGMAATVCGALVEKGADPTPMEQPLLALLMPVLRKIADEPAPEPAPIPAAEPEPVAPPAVPIKPQKRVGPLRSIGRLLIASYKFRRAMRRHQREMAAIPVSENEAIVNALQAPTIALICSNASSRSTQVELRNLSKALSDRVQLCGWLDTVFDVLDNEPLLVIEPSTRTGILARLSGTDVNFTLALLLMHYFPGPDGHPHSRLSAKAAAVLNGGPQASGEWVKGTWNLYNWQAIGNDYSLPEGQKNSSQWIWNEGRPADIQVFEGRRVILLGPPPYARTFPAQRTFCAMRPELKIEKVLTAEDAQAWLEKMAKARPNS